MSKLELVRQNFPDHFDAALNNVQDPSGDKRKYLLWIARQLSLGCNAIDIENTLKFFHDNPDKFKVKDIHKYKTLKDLEDLVKEFGMSSRQSKFKDKEGGVKIYEDDNLMVIRVDDKPAMVLYGANTRWCTTMKDHHYYEDYVVQGHDFYIVIRKKDNALASTKYAIVRKGLLEFKVYDAQDNYARSFSDEEEEKLRNAIGAIIADKPPKNYLREVENRNVPADEAAEWLKTQSQTTIDFIEGRRPELRFVARTPDELIEIFKSPTNKIHIKSMGEDRLVAVATRLKDVHDKSTYPVKIEILRVLQGKNRLLFEHDKDHRVRAKVIEGVDPEKAREFFKDHSLEVVRAAARRVDVKFLLEWPSKSNSSRKRSVVNEVIVERISQPLVRAFVLNQPPEVLEKLMT